MTFDIKNIKLRSIPDNTFASVEGNDLMVMPGKSLLPGMEPLIGSNGGWGAGGFGWGRRLFGSLIASLNDKVQKKLEEKAEKIQNKLKIKCIQRIKKYQEKAKNASNDVSRFLYQAMLKKEYKQCSKFLKIEKTETIKPNSSKIKNFFPNGQDLNIEVFYQYISE